MKFWQLLILSLVAMAAVVRAEEGADEETAEPEQGVEDDGGHAEPEPKTDDDAAAEPESSPEPEGEHEAEPEPTGEPDDEAVEEEVAEEPVPEEDVDEVEEKQELEVDIVKTEPVENEVVESASSKTAAGLGSENGSTSVCFSVSTLILSTLAALKFAH